MSHECNGNETMSQKFNIVVSQMMERQWSIESGAEMIQSGTGNTEMEYGSGSGRDDPMRQQQWYSRVWFAQIGGNTWSNRTEDGSDVGTTDGFELGSAEGSNIGDTDGSVLGTKDCSIVGSDDGLELGTKDGSDVGTTDGFDLGSAGGSGVGHTITISFPELQDHHG